MKNIKISNLITILILGMTVLYAFISIQKHYHFQTFGWDTAVFDQQIYFLSHFRAPYSSLMRMNDLGDHFQLITIGLGAISYWIWQNANTLFIIQALAGCFSAYPLYLISQYLLGKTKLGEQKIGILSLIISFSYLLAVPFQSMLVDEFHNEPIILAPLIFVIYFALKKDWLGYWISFLITILNKEMIGFIGLPLAIITYLKTRNIRHSLATLIVGVGTSLLLLFYIMPKISGTSRYVHFGEGNNPSHLTSKFFGQPYSFITEMVNTPVKRHTIYASLFSFGFIPLLAPTELILPVFSLAIRFYDDSSIRLHAFNNHYAAPFFPLLAVCFVFGIYKLAKWLENNGHLEKYWWTIGLYMLIFTTGQNYVFHGPINSLFKPSFYAVQQWEKDAHALIAQVPKTGVIASQNSLLPHLSQRDDFYLLPEIGAAEYIVVDLADGPNKFSPLTQAETVVMIKDLLEQKKFEIIWQANQSMLLKRLSPSSK